MSNSAGAVRNGLVLRLSVPAAGDLRAIAGEIAAKLAEQLGVKAAEGGLPAALDELAASVGPAAGDDVAFEFYKVDQELKIEARCQGRATQARVTLAS